MSRIKPSVPASVVKQARNAADIAPFYTSKLARSEIVRGIKPHTGVPFLMAVFPRPQSGRQEIELSFLLETPYLAEPFSEAFLLWARSKTECTRRNKSYILQTGFFRFLMEAGVKLIALDNIDQVLLRAFIAWLNRSTATQAGKPASPKSRSMYWGVLSSMIQALRKVPRWAMAANTIIDSMPSTPWPLLDHKVTPVQRLDREHLIAIKNAAERDLLAFATRWKEGQALLNAGCEALQAAPPNYQSLATCVAEVDRSYPQVIPTLSDIRADNPALYRAIRKSGMGLTKIFRHLYPLPRDIVPFVILFSIATAFNTETILSLDTAKVERSTRFGVPIVRIIGRKERAAEDPMVVLDASQTPGVGVAMLLDLLESMLARTRGLVADPRDYSRLFLFIKPRGNKAAKAFRGVLGPSQDSCWRVALASFITDHALKPFTLRQIRPTLLDEVHLLTGDILLTKAVGRQKDAAVVWSHYTSDGTKRRYQERLGEIFLLRERWRVSYGVIDPRARVLTAGMDRGAATPGFLCLDPMESPRPNQSKGRLCTAYGECPSCPLAAANVDDAASVALYLALHRAIYDAQSRLPAKAWLIRWAPVLTDLTTLIALVPAAKRVEAAKFAFDLPPVG
ncbi:hypothetical protein [Azospirillum himalayense]|uniref:Site-specific integrase n=1 Tax=Azospirillum himalayense TaxID=654847 RepID=A0ABW0G2S1_9PROT